MVDGKSMRLHPRRTEIGPKRYGKSADLSKVHRVTPYLGTITSLSGSSLRKDFLMRGKGKYTINKNIITTAESVGKPGDSKL